MDRYCRRRRRSELSASRSTRLDSTLPPLFPSVPRFPDDTRDSRTSSQQRRPRSVFRAGKPLGTDLTPILLLFVFSHSYLFLPFYLPPSSLAFSYLRFSFYRPLLLSHTSKFIRSRPLFARSPRCAPWRTTRRIENERTRLIHSRVFSQHSSTRYTVFAYPLRSFVHAPLGAARAPSDEPKPPRTSPRIFDQPLRRVSIWWRHTCAHATSTYDVITRQTSRRTVPRRCRRRRRRSYVNLRPSTCITRVVPDEQLLVASATPYRL